MFLRIFRGTGPGEILIILLTAILVWLSAFIDPHVYFSFHYDLHPMPLYKILTWVVGNNPFIATGLSFLLVIIISILIVNFNTSVFFINERTFLPALMFVLFTGLFPHFQTLNPVLPASLFLILSIRRIMDAYRKSGPTFNFFDASVLIGTGSLFYANLIWFGLLVIIGIAILRTGNLRELFLAILGLCAPIIITAAVMYATGKDMMLAVQDIKYNLFEEAGDYYLSKVSVTGLIIIGFSILVSLLNLMSVLNAKKIKSRKTFTELIWTFIISMTLFFVLPSTSVELIYIAGIPMSYFLSHYFVVNRKRMIPEIMFAGIFIIVALFQVMYLI